VATRSRRPAGKAAVAAVLAAGAVVGIGLAVDRALRDNGVERADAKLAAALRASTDALNARAAHASDEAERLASSPSVQQALAARDRNALAAVAHAAPDPILLQTSGQLALGRPVTDAIRRSATVGSVGEITVFVPLDIGLLSRIERPSDARAGIRLVFVRGGTVVAGPPDLEGQRLSPPPAGGERTLDGERYRAMGMPVLTAPQATELGALLPRSLVGSSGDRLRWALLASLATLATILLLVLALPDLVRRRRGHGERRRILGPRTAASDGRDALAFVGDALAATHDPEALLPVILGAAIEATGAVAGRLVEGNRELAVRGRLAEGAEPLVLRLSGADEERTLALYPPRDGFTEESRELARWLATQASIALENAHLHGLVKAQAVTDELTGLANRRRFMEVVRLELKRAERFQSPLGLVLVDLDDFKLVNDRYGHQTGDEVLRALGDVFRAGLRDVDLAARLGGEEFAVLLPETDDSGAAGVAERLRTALASVKLEAPGGEKFGVTASFGVAVYPQAQSVDELLTSADAALYRGKAEGKNRVVLAPSLAEQ
jgi:diguanylate cyclase (GGDEF)-like protein